MKKFPIVELVVKIASRCNFNCTYCYEYNMGDDTWKKASKFMTVEIAKVISRRVQDHIIEFNLSDFSIGLHGGEPLLMSPKKLDELIFALKSEIDPTINLSIGIQTNGSLINHDFISVFKKHNVHVSISLDGVEHVHDKNRLDILGNTTWKEVIQGVNLLKSEAPELFAGILSVLDVQSDPIENFDFLSKFDVDIDFLLPLRNHDNPPDYPQDNPVAYGKWYFEIYKHWLNDKNTHINVRFIKNILIQMMGGSAIYEVMTNSPVGLLTISTDGNIEGVDSLKAIGKAIQVTSMNIKEYSLTDALNHELVQLRKGGVDSLHNKCRSCKYVNICAGGYFPDRYSSSSAFDNPSIYCEDLYWLLSVIEDDLKNRIPNEQVSV